MAVRYLDVIIREKKDGSARLLFVEGDDDRRHSVGSLTVTDRVTCVIAGKAYRLKKEKNRWQAERLG